MLVDTSKNKCITEQISQIPHADVQTDFTDPNVHSKSLSHMAPASIGKFDVIIKIKKDFFLEDMSFTTGQSVNSQILNKFSIPRVLQLCQEGKILLCGQGL